MSFLDRISQNLNSATYRAQETLHSIENIITPPAGENYFNFDEYRQFLRGQWLEGASVGQKIFGTALGLSTLSGVVAGVGLLAEFGGGTAIVEGGQSLLASAARFVATRGVLVGGSLLLGGLGILSPACSLAHDDTNFNGGNVPTASRPITQEEWCEGIRSLTAAPLSNASSLITSFNGMSEDLRRLPSGMSVMGVAPLPSENPQYAYVLVRNPRYGTLQAEATELPTYLLMYERNSNGQYLPHAVRGNLPLGAMQNVIPSGYTDASSITFVRSETFRQQNAPDGGRSLNLSHPTLTNTDSIIVRFDDDERHLTMIPYGSTRAAGGADACAYYGQSGVQTSPDASLRSDASHE